MSNNPNQRWFFYNTYTIAGAPKLEDQLMTEATKDLLCCIVRREDFPTIVASLQQRQEEIYQSNKRLKKVHVSFVENPLIPDRAYLYVGNQHLKLLKVRGEYPVTDGE